MRVGSTSKDIANRFLTKAVALKKLIQDRAEDIKLLNECADRPESRMYMTAARSIKMTSDLIASEVGSLVGMHEKLVTSDLNTFVDFIAGVAVESFVETADPITAISFAKVYGVSLDAAEVKEG